MNVLIVTIAAAVVSAAFSVVTAQPQAWSALQMKTLESLSITRLPNLPAQPSNSYALSQDAMVLGQQFFFDGRLSGFGDTACASCHKPDQQFVDNVARAEAVGIGTRKTMSVVGAAYSQWLFWDGRADSLWAQALGPLENPIEHAGTRTQYAWIVKEHYAGPFEAIFGKLPPASFWAALPKRAGPAGNRLEQAAWLKLSYIQKDTVNRIFSNVGKSIAAFEANLKPGASRFDAYLQDLRSKGSSSALSGDEVAGLRLFIGKANCVQCHNGPRLTDDAFHNIGVPSPPELQADEGRQRVVRALIQSEFGCYSLYSDSSAQCNSISGNQNAALAPTGAFKTPSLRNAPAHFPYMSSGQLATLSDVIEHYNTAPKANVGISQIKALKLDATAKRQLLAFLEVLKAPINAAPRWLATPELPK